MVANTRAFSNAPAIERGAQRFDDPIERLRYLRQATASAKHSPRARWITCSVLALSVLSLRSDAIVRKTFTYRTPPAVAIRIDSGSPSVWPVEQTNEYDLYSNGLRIENRLAVSNEARSYRLVGRDTGAVGPLRSQPAGIVFHTSESDQAPFEFEQKKALKRIGHELLLYVRNKRAYHFLIDRFGRVHRIVVESDAANHAGHSVWSDAQWSYVNLNDSFLGVAFEASMRSEESPITEAQVRSARALTEMLRDKYKLPAENCVVHAQVSVNPSNRRIGWHTDWGSGFPFQQIGLPDNYQIPNPSIYLFGFEYDQPYLSATGPAMWKGLTAGEERVREAAAGRGVTPDQYRRVLQQRFRDEVTTVLHKNRSEEN